MDKPLIFFGVDEITFDFFGEKIVVEKDTAKVFLNGEEQFGYRKPHSAFSKENNLKQRKTILFPTLTKPLGAFMVTRGTGNRLFFSFWDSPKKYMEHGRAADWIASYWLHENKKEWFENDLHYPKEVF